MVIQKNSNICNRPQPDIHSQVKIAHAGIHVWSFRLCGCRSVLSRRLHSPHNQSRCVAVACTKHLELGAYFDMRKIQGDKQLVVDS